MISHPSEEQLQEFIEGRLTGAENTSVIEHLAICDVCLEIVDRSWVGTGFNQFLREIPEMMPATTHRIQRNLAHRIHLALLGNQVLQLAGAGMVNTIKVLLEPLFGLCTVTRPKGGSS